MSMHPSKPNQPATPKILNFPLKKQDHKLRDFLHPTTCPACGHHVAVSFYSGGNQPLTTLAWPKSKSEAEGMNRLPLSFVRCVDCGHVYNREFNYANVPYSDKPNLMYNRGQIWKDHLTLVRDKLLECLPENPVVIEIGCGDGHLLQALAEVRPGGRYIGFDPSDAVDPAYNHVESRACLFDPEVHLAELRPNLIISRHVFEHLMNPLGFIQSLAFSAAWEDVETHLFIEVPCIDRVFNSTRTVDFFYEHNSHFTTVSLRRMLARCSSEVELVERGYDDEVVYGIARLGVNKEQVSFCEQALSFHDRAKQSETTLRSQMDGLAASGKKVAVWGGTGKSAAFINQLKADAKRFPTVVDSDPNKVGTYVPGTGQVIRTPEYLNEHPADVIVITTQWRARDIALEIKNRGLAYQQLLLEYQGKLIDYYKDEHPYK